jgi:hypothetical protein
MNPALDAPALRRIGLGHLAVGDSPRGSPWRSMASNGSNMAISSDEMIVALEAFVPDGGYDNQFQLYPLLDGFKLLPDRDQIVPAMFALMERYPNAYLGTPGPLVHNIESLGIDEYEEQLIASVKRQPAELNVWMVNRILNVTVEAEHRQALLELLIAVLRHPSAPERVKEMAAGFLDHQAKRGVG